MRIFQAIILTLVVTVYGLVVLATLGQLAREACSFIFQAIKTWVQVKIRYWRIILDWRLSDRKASDRQAPKPSSATAP